MQAFPHIYTVKSTGGVSGELSSEAEGLPAIVVAPPVQFGGPGDQWSPEDLFMASIANCFILSFRAIASASKLNWESISCESTGELDKLERKILFTKVISKVQLKLASGEDKEKAERLLIKAEESCW